MQGTPPVAEARLTLVTIPFDVFYEIVNSHICSQLLGLQSCDCMLLSGAGPSDLGAVPSISTATVLSGLMTSRYKWEVPSPSLLGTELPQSRVVVVVVAVVGVVKMPKHIASGR
eukprot:2978000-Amphidinium_carterae.1